MKMQDHEARRKGFRFKKTLIFFVGVVCFYLIGFGGFYCKNCEISKFVTQLPKYENRQINFYVDIKNEIFNRFKNRSQLFQIAMLEANFVEYRKSIEGNYMVVFVKIPISKHGPIGFYYTDTRVTLVFDIKQNKIIPSGAMLRTIGL